jgi:hypothetical protein
MTTPLPCTTQKCDFRGWTAYRLENGLINLVAVPDIGGRIMAYDLGPYPFLFVDPDLAGKLYSSEENMGDGSLAAWKNYGGDKTWPAPQGWDTEEQWPGPPDAVLDTGRYTLEEFSSDGTQALVRMASPPDKRTGLQITRQFTLFQGSSRVNVDLSFRNTKDKPIRWSIWDVVQLRAERQSPSGNWLHDPECFVTTPLNPHSRFAKGFNVMFGQEANPQWQTDPANKLFKAQYLNEIGKVGIDSPAGWIAFSQGSEGYAFVERFGFEPEGEYPDDGVTVECWTVGAGQVANLNYENSGIYLMETEILSPLRDIAPGETASFSIEWAVCRCPGPVIEVTEAGCTAQKLTAQVSDDFVRLTGQFGVFDDGELAALWLERDGVVIQHQFLGPVNPLSAVLLDSEFPRPAGSQHVELWVTDDATGAGHLLASAQPE